MGCSCLNCTNKEVCVLKISVQLRQLHPLRWHPQTKKIPAVPKDHEETPLWALTDSNRRPSACKADALNQLS